MKNSNTFPQNLTTKIAGSAAILCIVLFNMDVYGQATVKVGVGETTPIVTVHAKETGTAKAAMVLNAANAGAFDSQLELETDGTNRFTLGVDESDGNKFKIATGNDLNANNKLIIQSDGNVAIGSNNAVQKFHVKEDGAAHLYTVIENANAGNFDAAIRFELDAVEFTVGVDDDANDDFKIGRGSGVGVNNDFVIDNTSGNVGINKTAPVSTFEVNGSFGGKLTTISNANYTATATDFIILMHVGTSDRTLNLPAAAGCTGRVYLIRRGAGTQDVIVDPAGPEKIDGATTFAIIGGRGITIFSDGVGWLIVGERN